MKKMSLFAATLLVAASLAWVLSNRTKQTEQQQKTAAPAGIEAQAPSTSTFILADRQEPIPETIAQPEVELIHDETSSHARETVPLKRGSNNQLILNSAETITRSVIPGSVFEEPLLKALSGEATGPLTINEHTVSAIEAEFDAELLAQFVASDAESIRLPVAEEQEVLVRVDEVIARGAHTRTLAGKIEGDETTDVLLVFHDGAVSGTLSYFESDTHFEYAMAGNGHIAIRRLDPSTYTAVCGNPEGEQTAEEEHDHAHAETAPEAAAEAPAGSLHLDTVIGYSKGARDAQGGVAAIEVHIIAAVDRMNRAFSNSRIQGKFVSLLGMVEDPKYVFPGRQDGMYDELSWLDRHGDGKLDTVSQLGKDLGADHCGFVLKQTSGGAAGLAYRPGKSMIVARTYMGNTKLTFAHEFGHNIGCNHSWGDTAADSLVTHSRYGLRFKTQQGAKVRTIMAYDWGWTRIPYFSNPNVKYGGTPTGVVRGKSVKGNAFIDPRYASRGYKGTFGAGLNGSNPKLGAMNAQLIMADAHKEADNARRKKQAVISPSLGDTWKAGNTYNIYWTGGDHTDTITLTLLKNGAFHSQIAQNLSAVDLSYAWKVPTSLANGSTYSIRAVFNGNKNVNGAKFSINNGSSTPFTLQLDAPAGGSATLASKNETLQLKTTAQNAPGAVTYQWSKVSGPGTVNFANAKAGDTSAQFSSSGIYTIKLVATSGGKQQTVYVEVEVKTPNTQAPIVLQIDEPVGGSATLNSVNDTLKLKVTTLNATSPVSYEWTKKRRKGGPGTVTFGNAKAAETTARFSEKGTYNLKITAKSAGVERTKIITVTVKEGGATSPFTLQLDAPAGGSATLNSVNDSLALITTTKNTTAPVAYTWSKVSGPGNVNFANAKAADTSARFTASGTYELKVTATSAGTTRTQNVKVVVRNSPPPPPPSSSAYIHYTFEGSNNKTVSNSSGSGPDSAITGTPAWASGVDGQAIQFTKKQSYITTKSNVLITDATGFTAMAWVQLDQGATSEATLIRQNGTSGRSWITLGKSGRLRSFVGGSGSASSKTLSRGKWHHVAITAGNGKVKFYLDGNLVGSSSQKVETSSGAIQIGHGKKAGSNDQFFGKIDDVRIYQRILDEAEIKAQQEAVPEPVDENDPSNFFAAGPSALEALLARAES